MFKSEVELVQVMPYTVVRQLRPTCSAAVAPKSTENHNFNN